MLLYLIFYKKKCIFKLLFFNKCTKSEFNSNFSITPTRVFLFIVWSNKVLTFKFNLCSLVGVLPKLLSNSPFETNVKFVALKSTCLNYFCIKFALICIYPKNQIHTYCFTYMCALFCNFSFYMCSTKDMFLRKEGFRQLKHNLKVLAHPKL